MEKKFYAIVTGSYSDYSIVGITDDEEKAHNYCAMFPNCEVEEYCDISNTSPYVGMRAYRVTEYVSNKWCEYYGEDDNIIVRAVYFTDSTDEFNMYTICHTDVGTKYEAYTAHVIAVDKEHARNIGLDRIAVKKAEECGVL